MSEDFFFYLSVSLHLVLTFSFYLFLVPQTRPRREERLVGFDPPPSSRPTLLPLTVLLLLLLPATSTFSLSFSPYVTSSSKKTQSKKDATKADSFPFFLLSLLQWVGEKISVPELDAVGGLILSAYIIWNWCEVSPFSLLDSLSLPLSIARPFFPST